MFREHRNYSRSASSTLGLHTVPTELDITVLFSILESRVADPDTSCTRQLQKKHAAQQTEAGIRGFTIIVELRLSIANSKIQLLTINNLQIPDPETLPMNMLL